MKNIFKLFMVFGLLIGSPGLLIAQEDTSTTKTRVTEEKPGAKTFSLRLEEAKKSFEDKISDAKEKRIASVCKIAQTKVAAILEKTQTFQLRHSEIHQQWLTKLTNLSARVATAGINTTTLDGYIQELNALVAQSRSDLENYVSRLQEISTSDCEADAAVFYSDLQTTRAARTLVVDDTSNILSYIRDNIKAELQNIKQQLQDSRQPAAPNETGGGTQ